ARYGIRILDEKPNPFANNDLAHEDTAGCDPERFGEGLRAALYNYMHGRALDEDPRVFFEGRGGGKSGRGRKGLPATSVPPDLIERAIAERGNEPERAN